MSVKYPVVLQVRKAGQSIEAKIAKNGKSFTKKVVSTIANKRTLKSGVIATGITAALITLYNIFTNGPEKGIRNAKEQMGENYADLFIKANSSQSHNHLGEKIKHFIRDYLFDDPLYPAYTKVKNVVISTAGEVLNNGLEITAAAGAIAAPLMLGGPVGLGIGAICAGFLAFEGASFFFGDALGIGKEGS